MNQTQEVKLIFAEPAQGTPAYQYMKTWGDIDKLQQMEVDLDHFIDYFKKFKIESIELSFSAGLETGPVMQLFVSTKGSAAITVILKPE